MAGTLLRLRQVRKGDLSSDNLSASVIASAPSNAVTADDLEQAFLSQIRRLIWGDDFTHHWNDDFVAAGIATLESLTAGRFRTANCLSTDVVGNLVYITGNSIGGIDQVTKCDVTIFSSMPAIGIIVLKNNATTCLVQTFGDLSLSGLTPGKRYFVGSDSNISATPPVPAPSTQNFVQVVGVASDSTHLILNPSLDLVGIRG